VAYRRRGPAALEASGWKLAYPDEDRRAKLLGELSRPDERCATRQVSLAEGTREYVPVDYDQVLKRWTKTESLVAISELDDLLTVSATFESWDFRWAYVVRYASDYRLTIEQRKVLLEFDARRHPQEASVLYRALRPQSPLERHIEEELRVDRSPHRREGQRDAPEEIVAIPKPGAIERTYFPYTSIFRQAFRVRFSRGAPDGRPTIAPRRSLGGHTVRGRAGQPGSHLATPDACQRSGIDAITSPGASQRPASAPRSGVHRRRESDRRRGCTRAGPDR